MFRILCLWVVGTFASNIAFASGATSSGGGNTYNNQSNPWFLESVKEIRYCIEIDELNMGVSRPAAQQMVRIALDYWKASFAAAYFEVYQAGELAPFDQLRLATQIFIEDSCDANPDVRFQLGVLTQAQTETLGNSRDYVGVAMRTSYDPAGLRGKGFVYISPEMGPLRPNSVVFADRPWSASRGELLKVVLQHEVGHIFGVPHVIQGSTDIMDEEFPALITSKHVVTEMEEMGEENVRKYLKWSTEKLYFNLDRDPLFITEVSQSDIFTRDSFALSSTETVVRMIQEKDPRGDIVFEAKDNRTQLWSEVGRFCWTKSMGFGSRSPIKVYVDSQQQVFTQLPSRHFYSRIESAYANFTDGDISGSFCSSRGAPQMPLLFRATDKKTRTLTTVKEGRILEYWLRDEWELRVF